jgi:hypothetical protein
MIILFVKGLTKKVKKMKVLRSSELNIEHIIKEHMQQEKLNQMRLYGIPSGNTSRHYENLAEEDQSVVEASHKEASHYYEFYKLLSQENYELGRSAGDFLRDFREKNKNIEEASKYIPKQMESIIKFTEECISTFHCYYNYGKSNTEKMLPYCRPACERYIYNKVYQLMYDIYYHRYEAENKKFLINQNEIRVRKSPHEIMEALGVNKSFRGEESSDWRYLPYKSTIDCLNKIEYEVTPKEKFDTLMKASLELRNCILDITNGKVNMQFNNFFRVNWKGWMINYHCLSM